ncbi:TPA_asm: E6 [Manis javanica papillomavirus 1]|nr:TPA_asm: E6 [Manis javanica papillomavirus 1]DAZ92270.1 TPA_asm: E6 [Manis javanica papillomavirus 1]
MAARLENNPGRVSDLARQQEKRLDEIQIPCNFCGIWMTLPDKVKFDLTGLRLIWKTGGPRGICQPCVRAVGFQEFVKFYEGTTDALRIEHDYGVRFLDILVRCHCCMRALTDAEKGAIISTKSPVHRVRGLWKSRCMHCSNY